MAEETFDLIVVGSGPAGYVGAIRASQLGMRVCVVERAELGGVCLNWGCIPTKALLHVSTLVDQCKQADILGITGLDNVSVDIQKAVAYSRQVAGQLNQGITALLRKNRVVVKTGQAVLQGEGRLQVQAADGSHESLSAAHIMLATGARPRSLPGFDIDNDKIWDYRGALTPNTLPKSLLVIGGGAIGMEFACFYAALGTAVTLVEYQDRLLPTEDVDVSNLMEESFRVRGIEVFTGSRATVVRQDAEGITANIESHDAQPQQGCFERVLVCAGVVGNVEDMGLENTSARIENGFIQVDDHACTDEAGLYAVGDVAGPPMLAHKASYDALRCVERLAGHDTQSLLRHSIPSGIYTEPQVASIGLTEAQAREAFEEVAVGKFPLAANGKAVATQATNGFVKTIFDQRTGELLGAHLVGHNATELLPSLSVAQQLETTEHELLTHMFPHPTLSEAIGESVMAAFDRAVHI